MMVLTVIMLALAIPALYWLIHDIRHGLWGWFLVYAALAGFVFLAGLTDSIHPAFLSLLALLTAVVVRTGYESRRDKALHPTAYVRDFDERPVPRIQTHDPVASYKASHNGQEPPPGTIW